MNASSSPYSISKYHYGSHVSQFGELFLPTTAHPPIVCLLHGGFWRMPYDLHQLDEISKDLASRGYAVWNIEYRRVGEERDGVRGTLDDVVSAVNYLARIVSNGVDLDLNRVAVAGHSAGGHLALWVAAQSKKVISSHSVHPIAAIGLAAITDLARTWELNSGNGAVNEFIGGSPKQFPDRYKALSPIELLPLGTKQLILHGTKDETLPVDLARKYVAAARTSGDNVEYVELPNGGHMDFIDPASGAHAVLCQWLMEQLTSA